MDLHEETEVDHVGAKRGDGHRDAGTLGNLEGRDTRQAGDGDDGTGKRARHATERDQDLEREDELAGVHADGLARPSM